MEFGVVPILIFIVVIVSVVMGVSNEMYRNYLRHKEKMSANGSGQTDAYARLEERVRVLERIATDKNQALASEIESLREFDTIESRLNMKEPVR